MVTKRPATKKVSTKAARRAPKKHAALDPTLWSDIAAIGRGIPESELANLPTDGAARFDDYYLATLR